MNIKEDFDRAERLFERAAQAWIRGNNSGNDFELQRGDTQCDKFRREAVSLLKPYGITRIDFPGLYPTFETTDGHYYTLADILRARSIKTA